MAINTSTSEGQNTARPFIISPQDRVLITGASGFIGRRVVSSLIERGFRDIVCFTRPSSDLGSLDAMIQRPPKDSRMTVYTGNLLSREDCEAAAKGASLVLHLAAGTGEKSIPDAYMNPVVATRGFLPLKVSKGNYTYSVNFDSEGDSCDYGKYRPNIRKVS